MTVSVGEAPEQPVIDPTNGWVYVPNWGSDNVSIVSGKAVIGAVALNGTPSSAVVDTANGWVYVAVFVESGNASNSTFWFGTFVDIINGSSITASVELAEFAEVVGSVFSPTNGCVYEVSDSRGTAFVLNGTALVETVGTGSGPRSPVYDPVDGYVYIPNQYSSNVTYLNGTAPNASGANGSVSVGPNPVGVVIDPLDGYAYVINQWTGWNTGSVTVVNGTSPVTTIFLAVDSFGYEPTQGFWDPVHDVVYVLTQGNFRGYYAAVEVIQGVQLTATDLEYPYGYDPLYATLDSTDGYLLATNSTGGPNLIEVRNSSIVGNFSLPAGTEDGAFDAATGLLYLPFGGGNASTNLTVLDGSTPLPTISSFTATPNPDPLNTTVVIQANVSGGSSYSYSGLPPGCHSANATSIACVPRIPGYYTVTLYAGVPSGLSASRDVLLDVLNAHVNSFAAVPSTLEVGSLTTGNTSLTLNVTGIGPFSYRYYGLPPGCASANVSPLPCTPDPASTQGGSPATYYVSVNVTDAAGNWTEATVVLELYAAFSAIVNLANLTVDVRENDQFSASPVGGSGSVTYAWLFGDGSSSSPLPAPTHSYGAVGNYTAQLWANDSLGGAVHDSFPMRVDPAIRVVLTVSNATPTIGQSVQFNATASGGAGTFSYRYLGLPPGCVSVNASSIGCLPTQAGNYNVTVTARDPNSGSAETSLAVTVVFGFTIVSPSSAVVGQLVSLVVEVATAAGTLQYGYTGLPPGCATVDAPQLTCTPTSAGHFSVGITVTSSLYGTAHKLVALTIVSAEGTNWGPPAAGSNAVLEVVAIGGIVTGAIAVTAFLLWSGRGRRPPSVPSTG